MKFVGCKSAKPVALCAQGANQFSHVLLTKSRKVAPKGASTAPHPQPVPEITDMLEMKALKAIALMNETTKAHFVTLDDDKAKAFLEKTADEQKAEAEGAAKAKKDAEDEAAALAAGKTAREVDLEKRLTEQDVVIKGLQEKDVERTLRARASTEFKGYPGGDEAAYTALKAVHGQPEAVVKTVEDSMKDRIKAAQSLSKTVGLRHESKALPICAEIDAEADKRAAAKSISKQAALFEMAQDKTWAEKMGQAEEEQREAAA